MFFFHRVHSRKTRLRFWDFFSLYDLHHPLRICVSACDDILDVLRTSMINYMLNWYFLARRLNFWVFTLLLSASDVHHVLNSSLGKFPFHIWMFIIYLCYLWHIVVTFIRILASILPFRVVILIPLPHFIYKGQII